MLRYTSTKQIEIFFVMNIVKLVKATNIFVFFSSIGKKIQKAISDLESRIKITACTMLQAVVICNN